VGRKGRFGPKGAKSPAKESEREKGGTKKDAKALAKQENEMGREKTQGEKEGGEGLCKGKKGGTNGQPPSPGEPEKKRMTRPKRPLFT